MIHDVIVKVTLDCNIRCKYCYVQRNRGYEGQDHIMSRNTLKMLMIRISDYLKNNPNIDQFTFYWHGGEPLLAGRAFFEECFRLQQEYIPKNISLINTISTNGILLDKEWINLIKKIGFAICLSLDGPQEVHDAWRISKNGEGTYDRVVSSIKLLQQYNITPSVLSVVTPEALSDGQEIYHHLRQLGITWMDFMYPFYSIIDNTLDQNIDPAEWGYFYKDVFDAWMNEGNPEVYIRLLNDLCMLRLGGRTTMCWSGSNCSYVITVDPSGNIYICDDLLSYSDSMLGNIHEAALIDVDKNCRLSRLSKKSFIYGEECLNCSYFAYCMGGCTLFRARKLDDFHGKNYFCKSQRIIIDHINDFFQSIISQKS